MRINKSFYSGLLTFFTFFILSASCNATVFTPSQYQLNVILSDSPEETWIYEKSNRYTTPGIESFVLDDIKTEPDMSEAVFILLKSPIKVIKITSTEAKNTAEEILSTLIPNVKIFIDEDYTTLSFSYWSKHIGRMVTGYIEPILIQNLHAQKDYGIVFKISTFPVDYRIPVKFFKELDKDIKAQRLTTEIYEQYKVHKDKGIVDVVAASIPTSYAGFKKFLDDKDESRLFEGIWTTLDSAETIGIVYVKNDPKFKYHAFIIKSDHLHWKPGEIKIKFFRLREGKLAASEYYAESKAQVGLTWKVERELLTMLNAPDRKNIILVKSYPTEDTDFISGVGTGWAISEDGIFVTNYHVIKFANKIYIGTKSKQTAEAKVLAVDKRNDLAILKIMDKKEKFKPIPIYRQGSIQNGEDIVAIGYPLAFKNMLGDDPRITNGIISAQSGFRKDVTRYQISATIQSGNSGGPVIDSRGKAVGVVVSSFVHGQSVNFAIKSSYLLALIKQAGIKIPTLTDNLKMNPPSIFSTYKESVLPVWTED